MATGSPVGSCLRPLLILATKAQRREAISDQLSYEAPRWQQNLLPTECFLAIFSEMQTDFFVSPSRWGITNT